MWLALVSSAPVYANGPAASNANPGTAGPTVSAGIDSTAYAPLRAPADAPGNLNADGVIDLIDLLRLRDIASHVGSAPTSQELAHGDLTGDGTIDVADVDRLREMLLRQHGQTLQQGKTGRSTLSQPGGAQATQAISNGDFSSGGMSPWSSYVSDPSHNSVSVVNENIGTQGYMLKLVVNQLDAAPASWQVQATQASSAFNTLSPSTVYELHFTAKASAARSLYIELVQANPSASYGLGKPITLTTTLTPYSVTFVTPATIPSGGTSHIGLNAGDQLGTIWIDDLAIVEQPLATYAGSAIQLGTFEPGENWFESILYPSGSVDLAHAKQGDSGRLLSVGADDAMFTTRDFNLNLSINDWQLACWVYTATPTTIGRIYFMFRPTTGYDDNDTWWSIAGLQAGWTRVVIPKELFFHYYWLGAFNWSAIHSLGIKLESNGNGPAAITIDDLVLEPRSGSDVVPPAIMRVTPTAITTGSATVTWTTAEPVTASALAFAATTEYGAPIAATPTGLNTYSVTLTGLSENQVYHCRIQADDIAGNRGYSGDFTFLTRRSTPLVAPDGSGPYPLGILTTGHLDDIQAGDLSAIEDVGRTDFSLASTYYFSYCGGTDSMVTKYLTQARADGKRVLLTFCPQEVLPGTVDLAYVADRVQRYRNHPAVQGWYIYDEPDFAPYDQTVMAQTLKSVYDVIKLNDPAHPVFPSLGRAAAYAQYRESFDILSSDYYTTPFEPVTGILTNLTPSQQSGLPFYFVFQSYSLEMQYFPWTNIRYQPGRFPSLGEMRALVYQSINRGASGLWTFAYTYLHDTPGIEWHWAELLTLVQQLEELSPLLNSTVAPTLTVTGVSNPALDTGVKIYGGQAYVIVLNTQPTSVSGTVTLSDASQTSAVEIQSGANVALVAGSISVSLPAYGVNIYRLPEADNIPPLPPSNLIDGSGGDVVVSHDAYAITASWSPATDASGIDHYEMAVGATPGGTEIRPFTNVGPGTTATQGGLGLVDGGPYYVAVRAVDGAGNIGAAVVSNGLMVEATAPAVAITAPATGSFIAGSAVLLSATASDAGGIAGVQFSIDGTPLGSEITSPPYDLVWDTHSIADANHTIAVTAHDQAGNSFTASVIVVVDNTAPPAPATVRDGTSGDLQYTKSATSLGANWTAVTDAGSGMSHYEIAIGTTPGGTDVLGFAPFGTFTSVNIGVDVTSGTTYYMSVRAVDRAGNAGAPTSSNGMTADLVSPSAAVIAPAGGAFVRGSVAVAADASDNIGLFSVQFRSDNTSLGVDTSSPYDVTWNTTAAADGPHTLTAIARDLATNATTSVGVAVVVDNLPPPAPTAVRRGASGDSLYTRDAAALAANWDGVIDATSGVQRYELAIGTTSGGAEALGYTDVGAATSFTATGLSLSDGTYYVSVRAVDQAGNVGAATASSGYIVDTTAPAVSVTAPPAGAQLRGTAVSVTAAASDLNGVAIIQLARDGGTALGAVVPPATSMTWNTTTVADGPHTLEATATDLAGNTATSAAVPVSVDNSAPAVDVSEPAAGAYVRGAAVAVAATVPDSSTVASIQFQLDGVDLGAADTTPPYRISWDTTEGSNGAHVVTAVVHDTYGATGASMPITVTVDNVAPSVAITAPSAGAVLSGASTSVTAGASDDIAIAGVQFRLDGASLGSESTTSPYATSWDTRASADGGHGLSAVARDPAGNVTASAEVSVTVDNTPPPAPSAVRRGISGDAPYSDDRTRLAANWDAVVDATAGIQHYELAIGTSSGGTDVVGFASVGTVTSLAVTGLDLADGTYYLSVRAVDRAGNVGASTTSSGYVVDTTAPTTSVAAPGAGAILKGSAVTVTGSAADASGVTSIQFTSDGSTSLGSVTPPTTSVTWNTTATADGSHALTATATDVAGNVATSAAISVTVDNTAPPAPAVVRRGSSGDAAYTNTGAQLAANWDVVTDPTSGLLRYELAIGTSSGGTEVLGYTDAGTATTYTATGLNLADGTYYVSVRAVDRASNIGSGRTSSGYVVDTTSPTAAVTAPAAGARVSGAAVTISAMASDANGVATIQFERDGSTVLGSVVPPTTSMAWNTTTTTDGAHTLTATATDNAGNSTTSTGVSVTVDNTAPTTAMTAPASGAIVGGTAVAVSATATDAVGVVGVQFKLDGANLQAEDLTSPYGISWNTTGASEGSHTLSATARDAAGNSSTASRTIKVDNVAPPAPASVRDGTGADLRYTNVGNKLSANWDAVVDAGSGVNHYELAIGTTSGGQQTRNYTNVGTVTTYTATGLNLGNNKTYYISVRAVDNAGRVGAVRTSNGITYDTTNPSVSITAPTAGATVRATVTVTASASDTYGIASVQFLLDGVNLLAPDTTSPYSISWNTTSVAVGNHTLKATATDLAGNVKTSNGVTVKVQR